MANYTTRADSNSVGPGSMGGGSSTSSGGGLSGGGMGGGGSNSSSNSSFQGGTTAAHNLSLNGVNQASNNGLGLTVDKYMSGNAAYGPAGGRAVGYATVSPGSSNSGVKNNTGSSSYANPGAGNGIGQNVYTTFRNPDGSAMFGNGPGAPGGKGVNASSGWKAQQIAQKMSSPYIRPTGLSGYKKEPPPEIVRRRTISKQKPLPKQKLGAAKRYPVTLGWDNPYAPMHGPRNRKGDDPVTARMRDTLSGTGYSGSPNLGTPVNFKGDGPLGEGAYDRVGMAKGGVVPGKKGKPVPPKRGK